MANIATLMTGTVIAQVIALTTLPILQRYFYDPAAFSSFVWFFEFVALFVGISSLRLETGIVLEKKEKNAQTLTEICLKLVAICSIVSLIVALIMWNFNINTRSIFNSSVLFIALPIAVFTMGSLQVFNYWFTREKRFSVIAGNKLQQTIGTSSTQIILGLLQYLNTGLILGRTLGASIASLFLLRKYYTSKTVPTDTSSSDKKKLVKKHKDFILFTTPSMFVDAFVNFLLIDLFLNYFGENLTGELGAAKYYLGVGFAVISSSFAQVFYSEIATLNSKTSIRSLYSYWLVRLLGVGVLACIVLQLIPNYWITYLLGDRWENLLPILRIMSYWMAIMFVSSSLSFIYIKMRRQKTMLVFDLIHLLIVYFSIYVSYHIYHDFAISLYWFTGAQILFYSSAIILAYYFINRYIPAEN